MAFFPFYFGYQEFSLRAKIQWFQGLGFHGQWSLGKVRIAKIQWVCRKCVHSKGDGVRTKSISCALRFLASTTDSFSKISTCSMIACAQQTQQHNAPN